MLAMNRFLRSQLISVPRRRPRLCFGRLYHIKISNEIQQALNARKPIVALESTIITHGLPYPQNIEMAIQVESVIRENGAIPATIAFLDGEPRIGLSVDEVRQLAGFALQGAVNKVSRRDISYTMAKRMHGGTTISGTMILSHMAGIKVFATGGLGGVHKGAEITMDISADLEELGRTPVAVVCAGPKAILDIEKTMEYLETKGCTVATMGPDGTNIPGFFTRDSGVKSPVIFQTCKEAAEIIKAGDFMDLQSGYLFCVPPPADAALDSTLVAETIDRATEEAQRLGVNGKKLTPFLLGEIARRTAGKSVESNVQFVMNNAKIAAQIAVELASSSDVSLSKVEAQAQAGSIDAALHTTARILRGPVVVGSVAMDTHCSLREPVKMADSNPGSTRSAIGGVGYNVALASFLSNSESANHTTLISAVGSDLSGSAILDKAKIPVDAIHIDKTLPTAQYISLHRKNGELIIACADMKIAAELPEKHLMDQLQRLKPGVILTDANVSVKILETLVELQQRQKFRLIFEPTSQVKATKISELKNLKVYPNNSFYLATPTVCELKSIFESFDKQGLFNIDNWFPVLDCLQVDINLKEFQRTSNTTIVQDVLKRGIFQMGCYLLPYFPRIIVKDGANGLYVFALTQDVTKSPHQSTGADVSFASIGRDFMGGKLGLLFEHYPIPNANITVRNVTAAGDTLAGVILNEINENGDVFSMGSTVRSKSVRKSQLGAQMSVEFEGGVSPKLKNLT
ncbi:LAMI_0C03708g1_1 [Lachancea mirantina]|uniref:LAMI_0C03708g1_1 n=1 Tax=Lachancea mirantina TaxID=1230905 RepID=A0A1G4J1X9_9SACH|nr:LAMI_0C03708g1_1 [Lachancea mirantina]